MALHVLVRVDRGETVQAAVDAVLRIRQGRGDARDAALCTEMVYGYLRTSLRVDAVLASVLRAPDKLPLQLRQILGLAVHSLLFLDRVPDHATVHWAVAAVGKKFGKKMGGLANGALRSVQRLGDAPLHMDFYALKGHSSLQQRCQFYSVPLWIGRLWQQAYGDEACEQLLRRSSAQPWPCMRINARHAQADLFAELVRSHGGVAVGAHGRAFAPGSAPRLLGERELGAWHEEGVFSWQAAGSLTVLDHVILKDGGESAHWQAPMWDACAGQGGKSLALMERGVRVALSSDVHMPRLRLFEATCQRLALKTPPLTLMAAQAPALRSWQGTILLDAPCSGLGTLARRPEIRARRTEVQVAELVHLQGQMLNTAWDCLSARGHLVYMTCTLNPAENEDQITRLLKSRRDAEEVVRWQTPHDHPWMEGMFLSVLRKC